MKKKFLIIILMLSFSSFLAAQQLEPIVVYKEVKKFRQSFDMQFGFAKGDLVIFKYKELEGKAIREIKITNADSTKLLYYIPEKPSSGVFQYEMISDDVLNFHIVGIELLNREFSMEILRVPASAEYINFNTKVVEKTFTDEFSFTYPDYKLQKIEEKVVEHKFKMFDKYIMQDVNMVKQSGQLKALIAYNESNMSKEYGLPSPPTADAKLYKTSYFINSVIGGSKHWAIVNVAAPLTVGIASSFLLTPAGGAAVGAATSSMLDVMGPNSAGEPSMLMVGSQSDMNKIQKASGNRENMIKAINQSEGDTYSAIMTSLFVSKRFIGTKEYLALQNPDPMKAKNYKIDINATYYAPLYKPVIAKEKIYTPVYQTQIITKNFKNSTTKLAPLGLYANAAGEKYELVEYPDTVWFVDEGYMEGADIVSLTPRLYRVKSQVTTKSELVYSQSFAAVAGNPTAVKIRLPEPINDDYQLMRYKKLKYTLTVDDATYAALKGHISNVLEAGLSYGIGKGTGALAGKMGKTKVPGDESLNMVQKIADVKEKYDMTAEVIESSVKVKDIYENGAPAEEEEKQEAFFVQNGKKANTVLNKVGVEDVNTTEYIPDALLKLDIPGLSDIADGAAGVVAPKIKDKINFKVSPASNPQKILVQTQTGFLVDSIELTDELNFNMIIENPRTAYDPLNFLSAYIFGNIMVEVEYEQINYKDMLVFEEIRSPMGGAMIPKQNYKIVTRYKYVPKSEMKPYYRIVKQ